MSRRLSYVLVAALAVTALTIVASAEEKEHSCPAASCASEKLENGMRCTVKPGEGVTLAALREHVTGMAAKKLGEGVTTTFEEKDGALVVTHTATDPELVKKLHEMADAKAAGKGCAGHHGEEHKAGCPHHQGDAPKAEAPKAGCPHHQGDAPKADTTAAEAPKGGCPHHKGTCC